MFSIFFKAGKRLLDNSLMPMLVAAMAMMAEFFMGGLTFIFVVIADFLIFVLGGILGLLPLPDLPPLTDILPAKFFHFAQVVGLWPAMGVYMIALVVAFVVRILTFGIGTRG